MTRTSLSPKQGILIALGVLFAVYCLFQARFIILGPGISFSSHEDGAVVHEQVIELSGRARNAAWISLNGKQIFTDEEGFWKEVLIVSPGTSIMTLKVRDRFGREAEESIRIVLSK